MIIPIHSPTFGLSLEMAQYLRWRGSSTRAGTARREQQRQTPAMLKLMAIEMRSPLPT